MKKLPQSQSEDFHAVKLFSDDVKSIVDILREVSDKVEITAGEFSLDSADELSNIPQRSLDRLYVASAEPRVSLDLTGYHCVLRRGENTAETRGTFEKIKELLRARRRRAWLLAMSDLTMIILASVFMLSFFAGLFLGVPWLLVTSGVVFCALLVLVVWMLKWGVRRQSIVILQNRSETPSFWERNRDPILVRVIPTLVGVIVGSALTLLFQFLLDYLQ